MEVKKPRDTAPLSELNYFVLHVGQLWLWWKKEFLAAAAAYTEGQRPKKNWGSSLWRTGKLLYSKDHVEIREPLKKHLTVTNRILFTYSGQCCSLLILYKYILCITKLDFCDVWKLLSLRWCFITVRNDVFKKKKNRPVSVFISFSFWLKSFRVSKEIFE